MDDKENTPMNIPNRDGNLSASKMLNKLEDKGNIIGNNANKSLLHMGIQSQYRRRSFGSHFPNVQPLPIVSKMRDLNLSESQSLLSRSPNSRPNLPLPLGSPTIAMPAPKRIDINSSSARFSPSSTHQMNSTYDFLSHSPHHHVYSPNGGTYYARKSPKVNDDPMYIDSNRSSQQPSYFDSVPTIGVPVFKRKPSRHYSPMSSSVSNSTNMLQTLSEDRATNEFNDANSDHNIMIPSSSSTIDNNDSNNDSNSNAINNMLKMFGESDMIDDSNQFGIKSPIIRRSSFSRKPEDSNFLDVPFFNQPQPCMAATTLPADPSSIKFLATKRRERKQSFFSSQQVDLKKIYEAVDDVDNNFGVGMNINEHSKSNIPSTILSDKPSEFIRSCTIGSYIAAECALTAMRDKSQFGMNSNATDIISNKIIGRSRAASMGGNNGLLTNSILNSISIGSVNLSSDKANNETSSPTRSCGLELDLSERISDISQSPTS